MSEIAAQLGVTESRISQLRSEALALLRSALHALDAPSATESVPRADRVDRVDKADRADRGRAATRAAYCTAVATRSTLADRLAATTAFGETRMAFMAPLSIAR